MGGLHRSSILWKPLTSPNHTQSPIFKLLWLTLCFSSAEVADGTVTSLPGATVTLICPGKEAAGNVTIHWKFSGSQNRTWTARGSTLVLRAVQLSDTGDYSCFLDDHLVGTVPLLVDGELCPQCPWEWLQEQLQCPLYSRKIP